MSAGTTETAAETTDTQQPAAELTAETDSENNGNGGIAPADDAADAAAAADGDPADDAADDSSADDADGPTSELAKVRREAASWRTKYRDAEKQLEQLDTLKQELFYSRVKETGRLADATDMEYSAELVNDQDGMSAAIDDLLDAKPHLKARTFGNVGQHDRPPASAISLGSILRSGA